MFGSVLLFFSYLSNKLYSETIQRCRISYKDSEVAELEGIEACIKDAIQKNKVSSDSVFYGNFVAGITYLVIGYRYNGGKYGTIILYGCNNTTIRANIANNVISIL